jgi:hypothetical protein
MTTLESNSAATSAGPMTSSEIDQILAAHWKKTPLPPISFKSDSEAQSSGGSTDRKAAAIMFFVFALAMLAFLGRRPRTQTGTAPVKPEDGRANPDVDRMLSSARTSLSAITGADVRARAAEIVNRLATELGRIDLAGLPTIHAMASDDGAFLLEWTIGRRRLGLNVEPQADDSSWYFVSLDPDALESASSAIAHLDLPLVLRRLVQR